MWIPGALRFKPGTMEIAFFEMWEFPKMRSSQIPAPLMLKEREFDEFVWFREPPPLPNLCTSLNLRN